MAKKKTTIEADLDPRGTRHTRPGSKAADTAIANSRSAAKKKRPSASRTRTPAKAKRK